MHMRYLPTCRETWIIAGEGLHGSKEYEKNRKNFRYEEEFFGKEDFFSKKDFFCREVFFTYLVY